MPASALNSKADNELTQFANVKLIFHLPTCGTIVTASNFDEKFVCVRSRARAKVKPSSRVRNFTPLLLLSPKLRLISIVKIIKYIYIHDSQRVTKGKKMKPRSLIRKKEKSKTEWNGSKEPSFIENEKKRRV